MKQILFIFIAASMLILSGCEASVVSNEAAMSRANAQAEASRANATIVQAEAARDVARMQTDLALQQTQLAAATTNRLIDEVAAQRGGIPGWIFAIGLIVVGGLAFGFMWMQSQQQQQTIQAIAMIATSHQSQPTLMPGWTPQLLNELNRRAAQQGATVFEDERGYLVELPTGQRVRALLSG